MESYKPLVFEFLPSTEWRIIKQMLLLTKNRYGNEDILGYVLYERQLTEQYCLKQASEAERKSLEYLATYPQQQLFPADELDEIIVQSFKNYHAQLQVRNHLIVTNVDQEKIKILQNRRIEKVDIRFTPDFASFDFFDLPPASLKGGDVTANLYVDAVTAYTSNLGFWGHFPADRLDFLDKIKQLKFL